MSGKKSDPRRGKVSASGVERLFLCPGSFKAEQGKPNKSNALADAGTRIHAALESDNFEKLKDDDERDLATRAAQLRDEMIDGFFSSQMLISDLEEGPARDEVISQFKEQRIRGIDGRISGQYDGLVLDGGRALVYDFKTGYLKPIEAKQNKQLRALAVLVVENHEGIKQVTTAIIQPRIKPEISLAEYSAGDLEKSRAELIKILDDADRPNAPRVAGEIQCKYCRAKADCPEAAAVATGLAKYDPAEITIERLPELLDACGAAKKIIAAIEEKARETLGKDPEAIEGYTLKAGANMAKIIDPQKVFNRMNERHSVLPHEFVEVCEVRKGRLKTLLKTATGLKGKALEETLDDLLHGLVKTTQKAASLAKK